MIELKTNNVAAWNKKKKFNKILTFSTPEDISIFIIKLNLTIRKWKEILLAIFYENRVIL